METLTYRHILVALDGSEVAERVFPHVEALAQQFGSTVLLLRAVAPPERLMATATDVGTGVAVDPEPFLEAEEAEREEARSYLQRTARRLLRLQDDESHGGEHMATITWQSDLEQACRQAREHGKLVLLDFFSPV
jgi:nucleotide-binding universal stress UspA family protein